MPPVGAVSLISARRPRPPFSATRPKPCQRSVRSRTRSRGPPVRTSPAGAALSRLDACGRRASATQGLRRPVFARRWIAALRVRARALVLAPGAAATAPGQAATPAQRDADSSSAAAPFVRAGGATYRGRDVRHEVIDGLAIHGCDMVLGTVGELAAEHRRQRSTKPSTGAWSARRGLSPVEDELLRPNGIIPYAIDPGFDEKGGRSIRAAIDEGSTGTVITWVGRTTRPDYARFLPATPAGPRDGLCRAAVGSRGGERFIWLLDSHGCSVGATIHDTGHALRLWHEHQRKDRDACVTVSDASLCGGSLQGAYRASRPARGPCDCASVMHYRGIGTIPPQECRWDRNGCRRGTSTG